MARATAAMLISLVADATPAESQVLHGVGIGSQTYHGRAHIVVGVADAFDKLEPGDVLVAAFIGPSINSALPMLGALVVEEGGTLCHAAIVAREFGLPVVVGAWGATVHIPDGALVDVDPKRGSSASCRPTSTRINPSMNARIDPSIDNSEFGSELAEVETRR